MPPKKRLTEAGVRRISSPGYGRAEHFDTEVPGFALRVTEKGSKSWSFVYRFGGKSKRLTLGKYPGNSLKEARGRARESYAFVRDGVDPAREKRKQRIDAVRASDETFKAICDRYIREHVRGPRHYDGKAGAEPKLRTWKEIQRYLHTYACAKWAKLPLRDISKADVLALTDNIKDEKPYEANNLFGALRTFFNWSVQKDLVDLTPFAGLKRPYDPRPRNSPLRDFQILEFWDAAGALGYPFGTAYRLLLVTGQRKSEVSRMARAELDFDNYEWIIPSERTKSKRRHVVPLTELALELLEQVPKVNGPYMFSTTFGHRPISGHSKAVKRLKAIGEKKRAQPIEGEISAAVGLADVRLHDLRETVADTMRGRLSITPDVIGQILNHAPSTVTTRHYASSHSPGDKRRALEAWDRHLQQVIGREVDNIVKLHKSS